MGTLGIREEIEVIDVCPEQAVILRCSRGGAQMIFVQSTATSATTFLIGATEVSQGWTKDTTAVQGNQFQVVLKE